MQRGKEGKMKNIRIGIDLGGTQVKFGIFQGEVLADKWEIPTRREDNGSYILKDITDSIENRIKQKNISKVEILGAGISFNI